MIIAMPSMHMPPSTRMNVFALLLAVCTVALLGLVSGHRGENWLDAPFLFSRADANVTDTQSLQTMPPELLAVMEQPANSLASDPDEARLINAELPFSTSAIEAAQPFFLPSNASSKERALHCLTQAIYYEAGFEPLEGRRAVAQVVLNRMRHPAFPHSVCGVIYQGSSAPGCQFSFTCDGSLRRPAARKAWDEAAAIAREALGGRVSAVVGQATHYHTDYVAPYWAPRLTKITQIGAHIFYRWPGSWGLKQAFTDRYAGEPAFDPSLAAADMSDITRTEEASLSTLPDDPRDRRAVNDVGGRLDVSKGWTLSIPLPAETKTTYSVVLSSQEKSPAQVFAVAVASQPSGGR